MTEQTALFDTLLANIGDAVLVADGDRRLLRVNRAVEAVTGYRADDLLTGTGHAEEARGQLRRAMAPAADDISGDGLWSGPVRCADGTERQMEVRVAAVKGAGSQPLHYLGLLRPVGAGMPAEPAAERRFGVDALTGLPDRNIFTDRVEQGVLQITRTGGSLALLMMGLDRFTLVNDALGHSAGDQLLVEVARRLRKCIRETDTVVRLDGDKFALVMAIAGMDDSVIVAEKVLSAIREPFRIGGDEVVITFSIGIALYPQDAQSGGGLIKQSENALHYAKVSGRNQYRFFSRDMNVKARARLDLETRLRRALANSEFVVYYQPKVRAQDNTIVGAEALVRWCDPERGMISPGEFIPVAEETGLIEQIGAWVLSDTCAQNKAWQNEGIAPVRISVNVSARQFRNRVFVDSVSRILEDTGLDPTWLELEITESMLMHDVEAVVRKMTALRELGLGLSIDDFGTGYSSLSYLGRFPITTLKIDRAFIADVDTNPKTAEIARAIIGLSKGLNLEVVAEGCEVAEHVLFLQDHGCQTVQGFYYSRPVPAEDFRRMLIGRVLDRAPAPVA